MAVKWEKVHVFISSTFNDMHAERDYLVKRVFPELQDWCEQRKLRLVDVDLRWGITEEDATANANVVSTCLKRIDDCRPFFLFFLGQRYGWIPQKKDISTETFDDFPGLESIVENGSSVTELEILHAIVRPFQNNGSSPDDSHHVHHSFFYLRDEDYINDLPKEPSQLRRMYTDTEERDEGVKKRLQERLRVLKEEIIPKTGRPVRNYQARWDVSGKTPEIALPILCPALLDDNINRWQSEWQNALGLDEPISEREIPSNHLESAKTYNSNLTEGRLTDFSIHSQPMHELVLEDLKEGIAQRYPNHMIVDEKNDLQEELDQHEVFLLTNSEGFIERGNDFDALDEYVQGDSNSVFALTAEGGIGKSMLLSKWIDLCRDTPQNYPDTSFHIRFIGKSDRSNTVSGLLIHLLRELQEIEGKIPKIEIPVEPQDLRRFWHQQLSKIGEHGKTVIVIDALNQLESGLKDLSWMPLSGLPNNIKLVVSFRLGDEDANELFEELSQNEHVWLSEVEPFNDPNHRRQLVDTYLSQYLKELDHEHVEQLITANGASNPLFLKVVLSELRVFGAFQQLKDKIKGDFGETPQEAFLAVLARLEKDPVYSPIAPNDGIPFLFGLILHARYGLTSQELTSLFVSKFKALNTQWKDAFEAVQLFLRQVKPFMGRREGRYYFFFESFQLAVQERYVSEKDSDSLPTLPAIKWHHILADFFVNQPLYLDDIEKRLINKRKLAELPYQQSYANIWDGLQTTLTDFEFLYAKTDIGGPESLMEDYETAKNVGYPETDLSMVQDALRLSSQIISNDVYQLPSQLVGRLMAKDKSSISKLINQIKLWNLHPWICPLSAALTQSGSALQRTLSGHSGAIFSMALDPEEKHLVVGCTDHSLYTWDLNRFELIGPVKLPRDIDSMIPGQMGKETGMLVSGLEGGLSSAPAQDFLGPSLIVPIPNSQSFLLSVMRDKSIWVWDSHNRKRIQLLRGHLGMVTSIAVTPDGRFAISGSVDGTVRIWDLQESKSALSAKRILARHRNQVTCVAASSDGQYAISGSIDKTIKIWEISSGKLSRNIRTGQPITALTVTLDDRYIFSGTTKGQLSIWGFSRKDKDLKDRNKSLEQNKHSRYLSTILSLKNNQVISADAGGSIKVWDVETGQNLYEVAEGSKGTTLFTTMAVAKNGGIVFTGGTDRMVRMWQLGSMSSTQTKKLAGSILCLELTPDGLFTIAGTNDGSIIVFDISDNSIKHTINGHSGFVRDIAIDQDGRVIVSAGQDMKVCAWDLASGSMIASMKGHTRKINAIAISANGRYVISGSDDNSIRFWDLEEKKQNGMFTDHQGAISALAISANGERAVSAADDGTLRIWDLKPMIQGMSVLIESMFSSMMNPAAGDNRMKVLENKSIINSLSISPTGEYVISGDRDGGLNFWDLEKKKKSDCLVPSGPSIWSTALVNNERPLFYCTRGSRLELWDIENNREITFFTADHVLNACATANDGSIAVASDDSGNLHILKLMTNYLKKE